MQDTARTLIVLHKLHRVLEAASLAACDLPLSTYACLLEAHEMGDRFPRARIVEDVAPAASEHELGLLESKELITYQRSASDRRALSAVTTAKGERAVALTDEALSVSLISMSGKLDEATFNHLEALMQAAFPLPPELNERPSSTEGSSESPVLLPAPLVSALCRFHARAASESNRLALSTTQAATLILLAPARRLSLSALSSMLPVRQDILMLQMESLAARSLVSADDLNGPFQLTEAGRQRANLLRDTFVKDLDADIKRTGGPTDALSELIDFAKYLFLTSELAAPTATELGAREVRFEAIDGLADLLALLSTLFSYPDAAEAIARTAPGFPATAKQAFESAGFHASPVQKTVGDFTCASQAPDDVKVADLRAEYTRLFYATPHLVSLRGADYVRRHRTDFSIAHGERAAVGLEYRKLGLKNKPGVGTPFDDLVSELDFALYLTRSESEAIKRNDAMNASEWRALRDDFVRHHLRELGLGVADEVRYRSENPFLLFYAQMLWDAVSRL